MLPIMMPYRQKTSADSSKYREALSVNFNLQGAVDKYLDKLSKNPFLLYACFSAVVFAVYIALGGDFWGAPGQDQLTIVSVIAENVGLLALRMKIQRKKTVAGISGMTMGMYAVVHVLRFVVLVPDLNWENTLPLVQKVFALLSLLLVFDVCRSVFVTHKSTYQKDLDVMDIKYIVPACVAVSVVLHPDLSRWGGLLWTCSWTSTLYLDVMALMPQVVMMAKGGGKVDAMISHFVAATVLSRLFDLFFWYHGIEWLATPGVFNYSGYLIIAVHVLHLLLVADFMYYHAKARLSGISLDKDLTICV